MTANTFFSSCEYFDLLDLLSLLRESEEALQEEEEYDDLCLLLFFVLCFFFFFSKSLLLRLDVCLLSEILVLLGGMIILGSDI